MSAVLGFSSQLSFDALRGADQRPHFNTLTQFSSLSR